MPIFQILLLVIYLRAAPRLRTWFGPRVTPLEPTVLPRTA